MKSGHAIALATGLTAALSALPALAQAPKIGAPPEAKNMRLVGHNDLQARSAYQPMIHRQGDRYIAYVGHHGGTPDVPKPVNPLTGQAEFNGTSIVDVTDPAQAEISRPHSGRRRALARRAARRWCACATARRCRRAIPTQGLHAARVRHQGARNLERHRPGQARAADHDHRPG